MKETTIPTLTDKYRQKLVEMYKSKYFNLFWSKYKITGSDATKEAVHFLKEQLWSTGYVAAMRYNKSDVAGYKGNLAFVMFTPSEYDIYYQPTIAKPTFKNQKAMTNAPALITFGKDATYMYIQEDHKSIESVVDTYIMNIVDAEMIIKTHEYIQKMPFLVKVSPENEVKVKEFMKKVWRNEPTIYITELEQNAVDVLSTGAPFILDKLYPYKDQREAELKTYLGLDNSTKMENTIIPNADMVNANNQEINQSSDVFMLPIEKFFEETGKVLGSDLKVELTEQRVTSIHDAQVQGGNNDDTDE